MFHEELKEAVDTSESFSTFLVTVYEQSEATSHFSDQRNARRTSQDAQQSLDYSQVKGQVAFTRLTLRTVVE
jgi:23S rRNA G2069 N7-methylase RlmK/C1962 C5-methylase RlmI